MIIVIIHAIVSEMLRIPHQIYVVPQDVRALRLKLQWAEAEFCRKCNRCNVFRVDTGIDTKNLIVMFKYIKSRLAGFVCDTAVLIEGVDFVTDLRVWFLSGMEDVEIDGADDFILAVI